MPGTYTAAPSRIRLSLLESLELALGHGVPLADAMKAVGARHLRLQEPCRRVVERLDGGEDSQAALQPLTRILGASFGCLLERSGSPDELVVHLAALRRAEGLRLASQARGWETAAWGIATSLALLGVVALQAAFIFKPGGVFDLGVPAVLHPARGNAIALLITLICLATLPFGPALRGMFGRINPHHDLGQLLAELRLLLHAGVPLHMALGAVAGNARASTLRELLLRTGRRVEGGTELAAALAAEPGCPPLLTAWAQTARDASDPAGRLGELAELFTQRGEALALRRLARYRVALVGGIGLAVVVLCVGQYHYLASLPSMVFGASLSP